MVFHIRVKTLNNTLRPNNEQNFLIFSPGLKGTDPFDLSLRQLHDPEVCSYNKAIDEIFSTLAIVETLCAEKHVSSRIQLHPVIYNSIGLHDFSIDMCTVCVKSIK